jgi:1,4-alpha-glucan branching enzyme
VPREHMSDEELFGQGNAPTALRAGFEEIEPEFAESRASQRLVDRGRSFPLGATVLAGGVNFSVFSRQASRVDLLLFDDASATHPARVIELDPRTHRTYHYWHVFVPGIRPGQIYAYRTDGPFDPERGLRFDPAKVLLDPYGRAVVVPDGYSRHAASQYGEKNAIAMKSVVVDPDVYDWQGDAPLRRPFATTVIYEMHVAGFTRHPSSGVAPERRGTYTAMIEKIPYLQDLGITAVELLPVFQFDRQDCPPGLGNYWGYSPVSLFAPHAGYRSRKDPLGPVDEFRDLVKALHRVGIAARSGNPKSGSSRRGLSPTTWRPNRSCGRQVSRHRCRLPLSTAPSCLPRRRQRTGPAGWIFDCDAYAVLPTASESAKCASCHPRRR